MGRSGAEMKSEQFRSEHRLSKGSEIRKGSACFKKGRQPGMQGFVRVNVERVACNGGKDWKGAKWGRMFQVSHLDDT